MSEVVKHTPGPWDLVLVGDGVRKFAPATSEGLSVLTVVDEDDVKFAAVFEEADARLIAAAPDLLEALKRLRRCGQKQGWSEAYEAEMTASDAAIAKAEAQS